MCTGFVCGVATIGVGVALVIATTIVGFVTIPNMVENTIVDEVVLKTDSIQLVRFESVPFPLNFTVRIFNITNAEEVMNGAVPNLNEVGPFVYKLHARRMIRGMEDDKVSYRKLDTFEFDPVASYPNREEDVVQVTNVAYHGVLQIAEARFPNLIKVLHHALPGIFGENASPIQQVRVGDLLFKGIDLCLDDYGSALYSNAACYVIRQLASSVQNMQAQPDGSIKFSVLGYRNNTPAGDIEAYRGLVVPEDLGRITAYRLKQHLQMWPGGDAAVCNMINGTDSGIFNPFIDRKKSLYALNSDICRSVELRYQYDTVYNGIPATRFSANEWFLDNDEGCFCLNTTRGVTRPDGCLHKGAMELFSCVGAFMVLSYPHFLYADIRYKNGVHGLSPVEDSHRIYLDIEPNTGTVIRGAKRAQFNVFMRPVESMPGTQSLRTTLTPLLWIEEGIELPDDLTEDLSTRLLSVLDLLDIIIPVVVALACLVFVVGIVIAVFYRSRTKM